MRVYGSLNQHHQLILLFFALFFVVNVVMLKEIINILFRFLFSELISHKFHLILEAFNFGRVFQVISVVSPLRRFISGALLENVSIFVCEITQILIEISVTKK